MGIANRSAQSGTNCGTQNGVCGRLIVRSINAPGHAIAGVVLAVVVVAVEGLHAFASSGHGGKRRAFRRARATGEQEQPKRGNSWCLNHGTFASLYEQRII
ncbi:MAG: hypothetical protein JSR55_00775 [Proteobacteria bacterium]|nr:hypothetical protein [Pseudomonadota bacterium]